MQPNCAALYMEGIGFIWDMQNKTACASGVFLLPPVQVAHERNLIFPLRE